MDVPMVTFSSDRDDWHPSRLTADGSPPQSPISKEAPETETETETCQVYTFTHSEWNPSLGWRMPRPPRVFVEGGTYHVYTRVTRGERQEIVRAREILMTLGVERYGLRATEMVAVLGVRYNSACLWSRRGATRRQEDRAFAEKLDEVDAIIASSPQEETKRSAENG